MLMKRLITAAILAPVAVGSIMYLPNSAASFIFGTFLAIGVLEWNRLAGMRREFRIIVACSFIVLATLAYLTLGDPMVRRVFCGVSIIIWVLITGFVVSVQRAGNISLHWLPGRIFNGPLACITVLLCAFVASVELLMVDPVILLLLFVAIWAADAGAYFVGKAFGKRKLALTISPGKTWEGVFGGLGVSAIVMWAGVQSIVVSTAQKQALIALGIIAVCFSVIGDLFESILKRHGGFKDSGTLLPGHGGVLDRIDGLIAAVSIFAAGYFLWVSKI